MSDVQEVPPLDPEDSVSEQEESHISSKVCTICLSDNLIKTIGITKCSRCHSAFCLHFGSKIDPQYCVECMSELSVTKETVTKTYERTDNNGDVVSTYSRRARQIKLDGLDWLFAQRKIPTLTDAELDMAIEYHRVYCNLLLVENERRRAERMHRYAGIKLVLPSTSAQDSTTTQTVTKTKKTVSTKSKASALSIVEALLASGMSLEDVVAKLNKGGAKP